MVLVKKFESAATVKTVDRELGWEGHHHLCEFHGFWKAKLTYARWTVN